MNYSTLVKQVAAALNLSQTDADKYLKTFVSVLLESIQSNDSVDVTGLGKFKKVIRKERKGVNPQNPSIKILIPESKALTFKSALAVKRLLNA